MKLITKVTDEDIGEEIVEMKEPIYRKAARGIVLDEQGNMAVFYKENKNMYKLPGGGLEENESFEEAFIREIKEEVGCEVKIIECLGYTEEYKTKSNYMQTSCVFIGKVIKKLDSLSLTDMEKAEGGKRLWMKPEEALEKMKQNYDKLLASEYTSLYSTKIVAKRDIKILEEHIKSSLK
ncbi:MAG: NUDIX domain-containing protein [Clostridia bacterium]|nr:NUDIX domain-containing protein [Clostridia bacterium]